MTPATATAVAVGPLLLAFLIALLITAAIYGVGNYAFHPPRQPWGFGCAILLVVLFLILSGLG